MTTDRDAVLDHLDELIVDVLAQRPSVAADDLVESLRRVDPLAPTAEVAAAVARVGGRSGGLGPIDDLLAEPGVTEVMVNGPGPVWVDWGDRSSPTDVVLGAHEIALLIERVLDPLGLRVDRSSPIVDARLSDGSRVNIVVPPLALDGPVVTIRRFATRPVELDRFGPAAMADVLADLVAARATVLVVGGTGAGKTTLLNALGGLVPPNDRVVTLEDTAELRLPGRHVVRLEARPANSEGVGEVTLRALVRNALRMRPDRLVIGEVRGPEALDLILALNTGHEGSLATCHGSDARGALRRLEMLALLGDADVPAVALREQLWSAIDVVVHVSRAGPERRVRSVVSVPGVGGELSVLWAGDEAWR